VLGAILAYQVLAPRYLAAEDRGTMSALRNRTIALSLSVTILVMVALNAAMGPLTGIFFSPSSPDSTILADYIRIRSLGLLALIPFTMVGAHLAAAGKPRAVMVTGLVMICCNILLDVPLIYGVGPLPPLGALGSAWASFFALLIALAHRLISDRGQPTTPGESEPVSVPSTSLGRWEVWRVSWPGMLAGGLDYLGVAVFFALVAANTNSTELAVARVAMEVEGLVFALGATYALGIRIYGGQAIGSGRSDLSRSWRTKGIVICAAICSIVGLILIASPGPIAHLFLDDSGTHQLAQSAFIIVGLTSPVIGVACANSSYLKGKGQTRLEMYTNVIPVWSIQVLGALLMLVPFKLGLFGALIANSGYWLVRAIWSQWPSWGRTYYRH
ncbi:MAG TPA: MATE family efflux transporter, partial [Bryobacteraceae bacterium]